MGGSNGMLDGGNVIVSAPYYISGKSGALTLPAAGSPVATLQHLGRLDPIAGLVAAPLRISQMRMRFALTSGATASTAFEIYKGAVTTQHTVGGNQRVPTSRKTTGYPAITAAETNLFVSTTGAISGGTFVPDGDPLDVMGLGSAATFGFGSSNWSPTDLCPLTLEVGQGLEVRVAQAASSVGIFWVAFDFLRQ